MMKKRILSLLLALTMLVSMLPVQALAEDVPEAPAVPETTAATEAPTIPETTAATEAPTIPETTAETEAPTVPETTAETEVPVESTVEATESAMTVMSDEANTCGDNLAWKVEDGTLTIYATAEEFGDIEDYAKGDAPWYSQRDSITTVDMQAGYWFGSGAFYGLSKVTLVKLPKCLVSFEDAFEGCTSLTSFCFPQGNEAGFAVDFYLTGDDGVNYGSEIVDESASDGSRRLCALAPAAEPYLDYTSWFRYISTGALRGCQVTDLAFKMDVTVDYNAFINCDSLKTVTVYKSATFADSVFAGCSKLESITFVADAPRLSANAFNGLDDVTIHYYSDANGWESVAGLDYGGSNITWDAVEPATEGTCGDNLSWSFDADTGVLSIDAVDPAQSCGGITAYNYGDAPWYRYRDQITSIDMNAGLSIGSYTIFADLANVTHINLPKDLEELSSNDFSPLYNLTSIAFPEGNANGFAVVDETSVIQTEGDKVTLITTAKGAACTIPDSVTTIGSNALSWRYIGDTLVIPATVTELEDYALYQCTVTTIRFTGNAPIIGDNAFGDVSANVIYPAEDGTWTDDVIANMYGGTLVWVKEGETPTSGVCGFNLLWDFDAEAGILTIFANDPNEVAYMDGYAEGNAPWYVHRENITEVDLNSCRNIGENAFYGLSELTTFWLSGDLEEIGAGAFAGCTQLTSFWGESTVYYGAGATILQKTASFGPLVVVVSPGAGETLYLPGQTSAILPGALTGCDSIQTITFPDTFRHLQEGALDGCNSDLTLTFLGIEPPYIEKLAFAGFNITVDCPIDGGWQDVALDGIQHDNYGANSITWPEELFFTIGEDHNYCGQDLAWKIDEDGTLIIYAPIGPDGGPMTDYEPASAPWYDQRDSITAIDMQGGITIGAHAFDGLINVTTVNLPKSLMYFTGSFGECTRLETFAFPNDNDYGYSVVDGGKAIVRDDLDLINLYAVVPTVSGEYTVPGDVQAIHYGAFAGCSKITKITFPENLKLICGNADSTTFSGCTGVTGLVFTGDVPEMEPGAFTGLGEITVSYPVQYPGWGDLQQEEDFGATGITWNGVYPSVESGVCGQFNALMWKVEGGVLTIYEPNGGEGSMMLSYTGENPAPWYDQRASITAIDMQGGITIGENAFAGLSSVTTVNLPHSLMYFTGSFGECTSLTTFVMPESDYGYSVVDGGRAIVRDDLDLINLYAVVPTVEGDYTVPDSVQAIHYGAFAGCSKITKITFPEGLVLVCGDALTGCGDGTEFVFTGDAPDLQEDAFLGLSDITVTYYADMEGWEEVRYTDFGVTINWNPTYSTGGACGEDLAWKIEDGTLIIYPVLGTGGNMDSYDAASGESTVSSYALTRSGESGQAPWYDQRASITAIDMRGGITIGAHAFDGLSNVTTVNLPQSLIYFTGSFGECISLETFAFPNDNDYGYSVVDGGKAIVREDLDGTINLYAVVPTVEGDYTVPDDVQAIHYGAFAGCTGIDKVTFPEGLVLVCGDALTGCGDGTEFVFTGDAPEMEDNAFDGLTDVTVTYPGDADGWEEIVDNFGEDIAFENTYAVELDESNPTTLLAGKSATLKASLSPSNLTKTSIVWSLKNGDDSEFATISASGRLTAKTAITEKHAIVVVAASKDGKAAPAEYTVTLIPKASSVSVFVNGEDATNGEYFIDLNDATRPERYTFSAKIAPDDAGQAVTWKVSDTKGTYVTYEEVNEDGTTELVVTPAETGKTGTVTVTATAADGSNKSAKVTLRIAKLAQAVHILKENVPGYDEQTDTIHVCGGGKIVLTTDVAANKELTDRTILWSLSDDSIPYAAISTNGTLTTYPVSVSTTITVKATVKANPEVSDEVQITLHPAVDAVTIKPIGAQMEALDDWDITNGTIDFDAECFPEGAMTDGEWSVNSTKVATIDKETGVLTPLNAGKVTVTFKTTDGSRKQATVQVTIVKPVRAVTVEAVNLPESGILYSGQTLSLKATTWSDEDCTIPATNQKVYWNVVERYTDENGSTWEWLSSAATISSSGKLTVKAVANNVQVYAVAASEENWVLGEIPLTIQPKQENTLAITIGGSTLDENGEVISTWFRPMENQEWMQPGESYEIGGAWFNRTSEEYTSILEGCTITSSNAKVASIDNGVLNIVAPGTTTLTAKCLGEDGKTQTATAVLTVRYYVDHVTIAEPTTRDLRSGQSLSLKASVWADEDETIKATNQKVWWEVYEVVTDPDTREEELIYGSDAATISSSGKLTAKNVTENVKVRVFASSQDDYWLDDYVDITIRPKQPYQTSIYQSGMKCSGTVNIPVNLLGDGVLPASELSVQTYVSVPGSEYDGTYVSGEKYNAKWSSSNTKVADFDANGNLVFTGTLGSTTITVTGTIDEQAVSAKVTLKAVKAVTSVDVQQKVAGQKLYSGKSINLTATVDSDATNKKVTWVSSDPSIATVSTSGQVKAGKVYEQKQVTIYAEAQDGFGTVGEITLTVYPMATTVSIMSGGRVMNNRVETISVGETVELTAVVYPIGEASSDVKWTPASNAVVDLTVGEDGVVTITAKKKGTVTIKAAAQDGSGKSASFKLTVNP